MLQEKLYTVSADSVDAYLKRNGLSKVNPVEAGVDRLLEGFWFIEDAKGYTNDCHGVCHDMRVNRTVLQDLMSEARQAQAELDEIKRWKPGIGHCV